MSSPTASCGVSHNSLVSTPALCCLEWGWACLYGAGSVPKRFLLCSCFGVLFDLLQHSVDKSMWLGFPCSVIKAKKSPLYKGKNTTSLHLVKDVTIQKIISSPFTFLCIRISKFLLFCALVSCVCEMRMTVILWLHMDAPGLPPCLRVWSIGWCVISHHGDTGIKEDMRPFYSITKDFAGGLYT